MSACKTKQEKEGSSALNSLSVKERSKRRTVDTPLTSLVHSWGGWVDSKLLMPWGGT